MPDVRQLPIDFDAFSRFFDEYFERTWLLLAYAVRPARPTEEEMEALMCSLATEWANGAERDRLRGLLRQRLKDVQALRRKDPAPDAT